MNEKISVIGVLRKTCAREEPFYSAEDAAQIIRLAPTIIPASEEVE